MKAQHIVEHLERIREKIVQFWNLNGRLPRQEEIEDPKQKSIVEAIREKGKQVRATKAKGSADSFQTLEKNIRKFILATGRKETELREVRKGFIEAFGAWLLQSGCADSHANKMQNLLNTVLRTNDIILRFQKVKCRYPDTVYLTPAEIEQIRQAEFKGRKAIYRDLLLVACYTGQRYSDLAQVKIIDGFVTVTQKKTGERVVVPAKAELRELMERYPNGLPQRVNQEMNRVIKEVAKEAGVTQKIMATSYRGGKKIVREIEKWEMVTTHTGRRSFATNALLAGMPAEAVMRFTGHRSYTEFQRYIRATQHEMAHKYADHAFFR